MNPEAVAAHPTRHSEIKPPFGDSERGPFWTPRRQVRLAIGGGLLCMVLLHLFAQVIWRLHGPQYTTGSDGWVHMWDRQYGFEMDLPSQYTRNSQGPFPNYVYVSTFNKKPVPYAQVSVYVCQPFRKGTNATTLISSLETRRAQGTVTIINDQSGDATAPLVDFIFLDMGNNRSRRRLIVTKSGQMEIVFESPELTSDADLNRLLNSVRWMKY